MAAYLIGLITVKDLDRWKVYVSSVPATLVPFGGEVVFRGERFAILAGELGHDRVVALRFPGPSAITSWNASEAYQKLIPLREQAADVVLIGYED